MSDQTATTGQKVTPDDLRAKFRELQGEVDSTADAAKSTAVTAGAVVATALVLGVFLLGRRRGRKRSTVVEIRRV
ncbi:MAG: hypothetical protein JST73_04030 [Actinobacteria bacterium]|nr:hypothetical protein [Actinomycetota bacterium]